MEEKRFKDRVALVTGAASGIGRATAERLAAEGARVTCTDINHSGVAETVANIDASGGIAMALDCDVSDSQAASDAVNSCVKEFGRLDVLANVAGVLVMEHTHLTQDDDWNRVLGVNLNGTFFTSRAAVPHLLSAGQGAVVNVSSVAGIMGQAYCAAYCASKAAVVSLTRVMAIEYISQGLRVNCVCPGAVSTPLIADFEPPQSADIELIKRLSLVAESAKPEEVAEAIAYLASPSARTINGTVLPLDFGVHAA